MPVFPPCTKEILTGKFTPRMKGALALDLNTSRGNRQSMYDDSPVRNLDGKRPG